jgi:N-acetylmuramoyl-L-alanine amidase
VLIELGYLSNPEDEKLLKSPEWRKKIAASITAAVDAYFAKRTAASPGP